MTAWVQIRVGDDTFDYSLTRIEDLPSNTARYVARRHANNKHTQCPEVTFNHYKPAGIERCVATMLGRFADTTPDPGSHT